MPPSDFFQDVKKAFQTLATPQDSTMPRASTPKASPTGISEGDSQEKIRSALLILALVLGFSLLWIYLYGASLLNQLTTAAQGSYIGLGIVLLLSLIATSVISGILRMIFSLFKLTSGFKDLTEFKAITPVLRIGFGLLMVYVGVLIFSRLTTFMSEQGVFEQINHYSSKGFEFNLEVDGREKHIEFKDGKLNIEDVKL